MPISARILYASMLVAGTIALASVLYEVKVAILNEAPASLLDLGASLLTIAVPALAAWWWIKEPRGNQETSPRADRPINRS